MKKDSVYVLIVISVINEVNNLALNMILNIPKVAVTFIITDELSFSIVWYLGSGRSPMNLKKIFKDSIKIPEIISKKLISKNSIFFKPQNCDP